MDKSMIWEQGAGKTRRYKDRKGKSRGSGEGEERTGENVATFGRETETYAPPLHEHELTAARRLRVL